MMISIFFDDWIDGCSNLFLTNQMKFLKIEEESKKKSQCLIFMIPEFEIESYLMISIVRLW